MSLSGWIDKENVVYKYKVVCRYNGLLFRLKEKETLSYSTNCMKPEDIMLSSVSQHRRTNTARFHLCEVPKIVKLVRAERRMAIAKDKCI